MRAFVGILMAMALSVGCVHRPLAAAKLAPRVWRIELTARFRTDVPPEVPALAPLAGPWVQRLELIVREDFARRFADGSTGWLLRITSARASLARDAARAVPIPLSLAGRAVELRTFGDGEILAIDQFEHLAGPGRQGEVYDLLLPLLSPWPPDLDPGQQKERTATWPLDLGQAARGRGKLCATWRFIGVDQPTGIDARAWHLAYRGTWTTTAERRTLSGDRAPVHGGGAASGNVWISRNDGAMLAHDFEWTRELSIERPEAPGGGLVLVQHQAFAGRAERLP